MILLTLILITSGMIYLAFLIIVNTGLLRLPDSPVEVDNSKLPTVSVVIAARDEEKRIGKLLESLIKQDYPKEKFEVIVVDDRSSDRTAELVNELKKGNVAFKVIRIRDEEQIKGRSPKKYALSRGIEQSENEIIVTTDADCWMSPRWLRTLVSPFIDPEVHGATGVSRFVRDDKDPKPWWSDFESMEHLSYSVAAAGFIACGHVFNAHGSNLAARRDVYERIGGYTGNQHVASGDDVFLLQDVARHGGKVVFITGKDGYVYSRPVDTLAEWINQRSRWSSKGFYYPPFLRILLVGTFTFYLAVLISLIISLFRRRFPSLAIALYLTKIISETITMKLGCNRFGEPLSLGRYILTQILHPPAILFAGIRGQFFTFTWKGQKFSGIDGIHSGQQKGNNHAVSENPENH